MPNYCSCDLYIHGDEKTVAALLAHIGADQEVPDFNFGSVIPYPDNFKKMDADAAPFSYGKNRLKENGELVAARAAYVEKYGTDRDGYNSGGYEWCIASWGTKWSASNVRRRDLGGACLTFDTAWSPPAPVILALHKIFPETTLRLEYFERGMGFAGGFSCLSRDDYYSNDKDSKWSEGVASDAWHMDGYLGHRGG